ncbi:hypothetical protein [Zhihengliuella halotolerans]|uniref:hypothetical protein n=1 Tax=Zhihengliuella halotolerans TaxID=370736 RepID=UPI000C80FC3D|nr:hypothetical protein [Zhihengliuella halotolerans]
MSDTPTFGTVPTQTAPSAQPQQTIAVAPTETAEPSVFDLLKAEAAKENRKLVRFDVEERPGFQIEVNAVIDYPAFKRYQAASMRGSKDASKADALLFGSLVVAESTTRIFHRGKALADPSGEDINFRAEGFIATFDADTAADAAAKFIGDGHVISLGNTILERAGYGAEAITVEDPTDG